MCRGGARNFCLGVQKFKGVWMAAGPPSAPWQSQSIYRTTRPPSPLSMRTWITRFPLISLHLFRKRSLINELLAIQPSVSKHWREHKALTQTSGLASSFLHPPPDRWCVALRRQYHGVIQHIGKFCVAPWNPKIQRRYRRHEYDAVKNYSFLQPIKSILYPEGDNIHKCTRQ